MIIQFGGERRRGCVTEEQVCSLAVVILDLGSDLDPGMGEAHEQGLVQQFIAHAAVKALDETILHRPARGDVMPIHPDLAAPG